MDFPRSVRVVYTTLSQYDLSIPVPIDKLAEKTDYSPRTVRNALNRLHHYGLIKRYRRVDGLPYLYQLN